MKFDIPLESSLLLTMKELLNNKKINLIGEEMIVSYIAGVYSHTLNLQDQFKTISPGLIRYIQSQYDSDFFSQFSRTNMDVLYLPEGFLKEGNVLLGREGIFSNFFDDNIALSHMKGKEHFKTSDFLNNTSLSIVDFIKYYLETGDAIIVDGGLKSFRTDKLGNFDITRFIHEDPSLGIKADDVGRWLNGIGVENINVYLDSNQYIQSQGKPYINKIRLQSRVEDLSNPGNDFLVLGGGLNMHLSKGAYLLPANYRDKIIEFRNQVKSLIK